MLSPSFFPNSSSGDLAGSNFNPGCFAFILEISSSVKESEKSCSSPEVFFSCNVIFHFRRSPLEPLLAPPPLPTVGRAV